MTNKPWFIAGAGAIGCLWAAKWIAEGQNVIIITRTVPEIHNIILEENETSHFSTTFIDYQTKNQAAHQPIDKLLITSKSHSTASILQALKPYLSPTATIIILQNGMATKQIPTLQSQRLLAASTTDGAFSRKRFHSVYAGKGKTVIGELNHHFTLSNTLELRKTLPHSLNIEAVDNIEEQLWKKLAVNCAINGLTVKYDCLNGALLENPASQIELQQICQEIIHLGSVLKLGNWLQQLPETVQQVLQHTANNSSSMREDVRHQRKTEIREINGYFCSIAKEHAVAHSANQAITDYILRQEEQYIKP